MKELKKPELLCPAGNLEKALLAFHFGADAVYIGGTVFGLRKYADNFSLPEIKTLIKHARQLNKAVYVVLNAFAHNDDIQPIIDYLKELDALKPDAVIVSDLGVATLVTNYTSIPLHVSTQASVSNAWGSLFWKNHGAKRVILAREVSVEDCKTIFKDSDIELEIFIHGAMCASYSGKCVISNYSAGRDSNRGGCVQSCRHKYNLSDPKTDEKLGSEHIMNAKDLMGIDQLPSMIKAGIASLKIEGRMKSNLYVANAASVYRQAIDYCYSCMKDNTLIEQEKLNSFKDQLSWISNRSFSSGGLDHRPFRDSINYEFTHYQKKVDYVGCVRDKIGNSIFSETKINLNVGETLLCISPNNAPFSFKLESLHNSLNEQVDKINPNSIFRFDNQKIDQHSVLAKLINN
ncbi:hypothetical protein DID78_01825 [Candidatus Marinamargulisbacteria bacterium SCGC AG-343-D04]|nr:hypothetical protein DID78_01825 [Candidatus Marinamargulisbacteria bacterium SCGC AG-343-D04]